MRTLKHKEITELKPGATVYLAMSQMYGAASGYVAEVVRNNTTSVYFLTENGRELRYCKRKKRIRVCFFGEMYAIYATRGDYDLAVSRAVELQGYKEELIQRVKDERSVEMVKQMLEYITKTNKGV